MREIVSETEIRNLIRRLILEQDTGDTGTPEEAEVKPAFVATGMYPRDREQDPAPLPAEIGDDGTVKGE